MITTTREELAWAAGFFDGEGCVGIVRGSPTRPPKSIRVGISQLDSRVLERFKAAVGVGYIHGPTKRYGTSQPQYRYVAQHHPATQAICALLWTWLSPVKREQFKRCLMAIRDEMIVKSPCSHGVRRSKCVPCNRDRAQRRTTEYRMRRLARAMLTA